MLREGEARVGGDTQRKAQKVRCSVKERAQKVAMLSEGEAKRGQCSVKERLKSAMLSEGDAQKRAMPQ